MPLVASWSAIKTRRAAHGVSGQRRKNLGIVPRGRGNLDLQCGVERLHFARDAWNVALQMTTGTEKQCRDTNQAEAVTPCFLQYLTQRRLHGLQKRQPHRQIGMGGLHAVAHGLEWSRPLRLA